MKTGQSRAELTPVLGIHRIRGIGLLCAFMVAAGLPARGSTLLSWELWNAAFTDGQISTQSTTQNGVTTSHAISVIDSSGTPDVSLISPSPEIIRYPDTGYAFNGGQGNPGPFYVDLFFRGAFVDEGIEQTLDFTSAAGVDNLRFAIWDIDSEADNSDGHTFIDRVVVTAELADGSIVAPTAAFIANTAFVQQGGDASTFIGIDGQQAGSLTSDGNVDFQFDYNDIVAVRIEYTNSLDNGRFSGQGEGAGTGQAVGLTDLISAVDSQITFDTAFGAVPNGGSTGIDLGSVFLGRPFSATPITLESTGNQGTNVDLGTSGAATTSLVGANTALDGTANVSGITGRNGAGPTTNFTATLETASNVGVSTGVILNDNLDGVTDLTGVERGTEDPNDTINLTGSTYAHANGTFVDVSGGPAGPTIDDDTWAIDFGAVQQDSGILDIDFGLANLPIDFTADGLSFTVQLEVSSTPTVASATLDGQPDANATDVLYTDTITLDDVSAGALATVFEAYFDTNNAEGQYEVVYTITPLDDVTNVTLLGIAADPTDPFGGGAPLVLTLTGEIIPEPETLVFALLSLLLVVRRKRN
ncbi:MAG: hypothetical protein AAGJ79_02940 [Verrucomicrobiota bacterium]